MPRPPPGDHHLAVAKYDALRLHLEGATDSEVSISFDEVADLVGGLPSSALNHRAWWANDVTHVHGRAWMSVGWQVADVNLGARRVRFVRVGRASPEDRPYRLLVNALLSQAEEELARRHGARVPHSEAPPAGARPHPSDSIVRVDPTATLLVIPCSKSKATTGYDPGDGGGILRHLPNQLAERLAAARVANRERARIDERTLLPAWRRYTGSLYEAASETIGGAVGVSTHILILSGGYGVVRADEAIGWYEAVFDPARWPRGLIEECLVQYAKRHELTSLVALAGATTTYAGVIRRTRWQEAGMKTARLITPDTVGGGSMRKVPQAIGEALRALLGAGLWQAWSSSDGTSLNSEPLV